MRVIPQTLIAGDTIKIDIPAIPSFTQELRIVDPAGLLLTYPVVSDQVVIDANDSANLIGGTYGYALIKIDGMEQYTVEAGQLTVKLRADLLGGESVLSHAQRMLKLVELALENPEMLNSQSYSIKDRSLSLRPTDELLALRRYYLELVRQEQGRGYANQLRIVME